MFGHSFLNVFKIALGAYDLDLYENDPDYWKGYVFSLGFFIINSFLLLNYVIAVMTDTYANLEKNRLGLYYDGLMKSFQRYRYDSRYGALVITPFPLNIVIAILSPFFIIIKNEAILKKLNQFCVKLGYFPFAVLFTAIFATTNVLLLPFAYLAASFKKI